MADTLSVLVVDDNEELAENLQEILEEEGIEVEVANDGAEALARLEGNRYSLVITDMKMPKVGGLELVQQLKRSAPETPVLLMTAYTDYETLDAAHCAGALTCLPKPIDFGRLLTLVGRVLGGRHRVLLLDDDAQLRIGLTEALLEDEEILPCPAPDLKTARRLAATLEFSAAVVDLRLPDGSGMDVAEDLRAEGGVSVPVILYSGYLEPGKSTDAHVTLSKPVHTGRLIEAIRDAQKVAAT